MLSVICCLLLIVLGMSSSAISGDIFDGANFIYSNNTITVTNVEIEGKLYWGEFDLRVGDNLCFCLEEYGEMTKRVDVISSLEALGAVKVDAQEFMEYGLVPDKCDDYYKLQLGITNSTESVLLYCLHGNLVRREAYIVRDVLSGLVVKVVKYNGYEVLLRPPKPLDNRGDRLDNTHQGGLG